MSCGKDKKKNCFIDMKEVKLGDYHMYMGNNTYCDDLGVVTAKTMVH